MLLKLRLAAKHHLSSIAVSQVPTITIKLITTGMYALSWMLNNSHAGIELHKYLKIFSLTILFIAHQKKIDLNV